MCVLVACGRNSWDGTYVGSVIESSQLTRLEANGASSSFTGGRSQDNMAVTLAREGSDKALLTIGNCKLRLKVKDDSYAEVDSSLQTCDVSINGFNGPLYFSGQAFFDNDGQLRLQLMGTANSQQFTGGYSYVFSGQRKS